MSVEKWIPIEEEKTMDSIEEQGSPCESKEPYVLMVLGDSMLPEFAEGDVIVIEPTGVAHDGSYVIAHHNGEYTFRQLRIIEDRYYIQALNGAYPTHQLRGLDAIKGIITQKKGKGRGNRKSYT